MMQSKPDLKSMTALQLSDYMESIGEKRFRAKQLFEWMHVRRAASFDDMTNLPKQLRDRLKRECLYTTAGIEEKLVSAIDGTEKYLLAMDDGNIVEAVLMRYEHGLSICISSQVGCRMGCRFCASTIDGRVRDLTAAEMLEEVYRVQQEHPDERISHVVLMGSGEPLDNFDNVTTFIELICDENGFGLSRRNITLSTCGLVPEIRRLADLDLKVTLALSLHAPDDETRRKTMPIANKYSIHEILEACTYYFDRTGRRVTFEYALIAGLNDSREQAERLAGLVYPLHGHVNLIPVNHVEERDYRRSQGRDIRAFKNMLESKGINVTIRREMGRDISGACGQLRRHYLHENDGGGHDVPLTNQDK